MRILFFSAEYTYLLGFLFKSIHSWTNEKNHILLHQKKFLLLGSDLSVIFAQQPVILVQNCFSVFSIFSTLWITIFFQKLTCKKNKLQAEKNLDPSISLEKYILEQSEVF